jgi:hypothetical protein
VLLKIYFGAMLASMPSARILVIHYISHNVEDK